MSNDGHSLPATVQVGDLGHPVGRYAQKLDTRLMMAGGPRGNGAIDPPLTPPAGPGEAAEPSEQRPPRRTGRPPRCGYATEREPDEITPPPMRPCVGCRGRVPDVTGPVHPYMTASPGCWQWYGELVSEWLATAPSPEVRLLHVDCFAVQHPVGADHDRRQRRSVAVHLTALCLFQEYGITAERVLHYRKAVSRTVLPRLGLSDWPYLGQPLLPGAVTVADLHEGWRAGTDSSVADWIEESWQAWAPHHATVRFWAQALLGGAG